MSPHFSLSYLVAELFGGPGDADQRGPQVAVDVVGQRLQRGDVQHPGARASLAAGVRRPACLRSLRPLTAGRQEEAVDGVEERRERLARSGRCRDEHVVAGGGGLPGRDLRRRRSGERLGEPGPRGLGEPPEGVVTVHTPTIRIRWDTGAPASRQLIADGGHVSLESDFREDTHYPLDYAPRPDSLARSLFADEIVERQLDALAARQQADGGWPINWLVWTPATQLEWRAVMTIAALQTLRAYRRLR